MVLEQESPGWCFQKGETIYLETYMELDGNVMKQYLSYWSDKDIPTDKDYLKQKQ